MDAETPFDRRLRRIRRDRAARLPDTDRYLHAYAADELLARLDAVTRDLRDVLDLGSGDGRLAALLQAKGMNVVRADGGRLFSEGGIQCDEDRLPFADSQFDLVVSVGALDSVNDLPGALTLIRRALRPDGLFLAAFAGAGSLPRLRSAMLAADEAQEGRIAPRIHPQIDIRAAGDLLSRAGFTLPVVDGERLTLRFPHLMRLVADLRAMGSTNILRSRDRSMLGRAALAAALNDFAAAAESDGKTAEQIELIYMTGWSPAPSQPQPARRGSAGRSLADALKKKD